MSQTDPKKLFLKYAPSGPKFLLHGGYAILLSMVLGYIYGMYFMPLPPDLHGRSEHLVRLGLGVGDGLLSFPVPVGVLLIVRHVYQLFRAQKRAMEDFNKELLDKYVDK